MKKGNHLQSTNGVYKFILQQNGNLEILCQNTSIWSSNTFDPNIEEMHFTETGVVTLRKPSSNFDVWRSDLRWHASINPVNLVMQNDGNLRAFERNHRSNEIVQYLLQIQMENVQQVNKRWKQPFTCVKEMF